jgi:hypothetical protein
MLGKLTIGAPAFAVVLVACGGSQPPIGEPGDGPKPRNRHA